MAMGRTGNGSQEILKVSIEDKAERKQGAPVAWM